MNLKPAYHQLGSCVGWVPLAAKYLDTLRPTAAVGDYSNDKAQQ